ncbi:FAD-dependent oxidoreductase [Nakamurella flava]|uniref:FAD-dependent oxidoreductase n=1 Tax=Nakamurella flava TaxID=2576308 RepID=A0A4U6QKI4_9ACTN|nr:FAD-dependent oxidoreductase [Nakamurella flava]TKV61020.1 FAD-dependent oxidoreductase [Nakamurella flava]
MTSLWLDRTQPSHPLPENGREFDVLVIGAGLTGLTTALLLSRAGHSVGVVEASRVGAGTTGHTTAKVSLLQGTRLSTIRSRHSAEIARQYVEANTEGQMWLRHYCEENDVPYQLRSAYTYAAGEDGIPAVQAELRATHEAGLPTTWVTDTELPYPIAGAVQLAEQAQIDPLDVLTAMVTDLQRRGATIYEGARVRSVDPGTPVTVRTDDATLRAGRVVLATGTPIMDRGGFWARLQPLRSYAVAFHHPGPMPQGMYLSADSPSRSVRSVPRPDGDRLLIGGNGHVVGRERHPARQVQDLTDWTRRWFPGAEPTHSWSAQDYHADHELPFVGPLTPTDDQILVATGFDKWGMTLAVASALALSSRILGGRTDWAQALQSWTRREFAGAPTAVKSNLQVGAHLVGGWASSILTQQNRRPPAENTGRVERQGLTPTAVSTVDGATRRRSAVCTHLGGVLTWNDAECSWDCPLHGSRFAPDGAVLEGPATRDLPEQ